MRTPDEAMPEPSGHGGALARFSEMQSPDPNTFLREAWPHLDPGQKELAQTMLAPRVEGGGPLSQPQPEPNATPAQYMTQASGRPTPERLGVEPEMGGMPQPENRTFAPADQLMRETLQGMPQAFQAYGNAKISRPEIAAQGGQWAYGQPLNSGGWYDPGQQTINVPRGNDYGMTPWGPGGQQQAVTTARHELVHKSQFENPAYATDTKGGWPQFISALQADMPALQQPAADNLRSEISRFMNDGDVGHAWTAAAEAHMKGIRPPNLSKYFAALDQPMPEEKK